MMTVTMEEFAEQVNTYARNGYGYGVAVLGHPTINSIRVGIRDYEDDDKLGGRGEWVITDIGEWNGRCMVEVRDLDSDAPGIQMTAIPAAVFAVMYA